MTYIPETKAKHTWYYFSDGSYRTTAKPQYAPTAVPKPWTEAVRISSAVLEDSDGTGSPRGFATVNRSGILVFKGSDIQLCADTEIFTGRTAGNLVFAQGVPFFSVYKSTFFNERSNVHQIKHPFLVQFNPTQNVMYPIINVENLGLSDESEITDFLFDGQYWTCSVKKSDAQRVTFSYITFQAKEDISLITPYTAQKMLHVSDADMESFRNAKKPLAFSKAPERLRELLRTIPEDVHFSVDVYTAGGHSPRTYIRAKNQNAETEELTARALLSDTWLCCLFNDGTLYLNGALYERHILNGGKTLGIKLPKLPADFVYGDFVISGTMLYASWEETSFYETKRSGFISVDLDKTLYK